MINLGVYRRMDEEKPLLCRVCINGIEVHSKSFNIFQKHEDILTPGTLDDDILIVDKITACADVKIKPDDGLPGIICSSCLLELEEAYNFRKKCEKSDSILKTTHIEHQKVAIKEELCEFDYDDNVSDDNRSLLGNDISNSLSIVNSKKIEVDTNVLVTKSRNLNLICHDCGCILSSKCKMRLHQKKEHSKLPVTCSSCHVQFKSFRAYHNHRKNTPQICVSLSQFRIEGVGTSRIYHCKKCQFVSKSRNTSVNHLMVHIKTCSFKCDQCDRSFRRPITLRAHKERVHKQYFGQKTCHICGKILIGFTKFDSHMRMHREAKISFCDICNKQLSSKSAVVTHKKLHSDEKQFSCEKCPKTFRTSAGLYIHRNYVHMEKKCVCKVCGYTVKCIYRVRKHEKEHNDYNVGCNVCGRFFDKETELELHKKVHENKPHPCDYCERTYTARKNLTEHLRKKHKIYVSSKDLNGLNIKTKKKIKTDPH